jgi:hypothetical protein
MAAGRLVDRNPPPEPEPEISEPEPQGESNPAIEGARLVFSSPYLLSIVAIVGLYEIVSTVMDFQFTSTIAHYLSGPAIGQQFATVFAITNIVSMLVQLFLTSFVMSRLGVGVALMFLPIAVLAGSMGFTVLPILWMGSSLNTVDNAVGQGVPVRPNHQGRKVQSQGFHRHVRAALCQSGGSGRKPRDHSRVQRVFQHPLALRFHHSDYHHLDLRGALCRQKVQRNDRRGLRIVDLRLKIAESN